MNRLSSWRVLRHLPSTSASFSHLQRVPALRTFHRPPTLPILRKHVPTNKNAKALRRSSDIAAPKSLTDRPHEQRNESAEEIASRKAQEPAYQMTFTCKQCSTRSSHRITKQAYHHGTTLITCPGCKNRHLMSDHLKVRQKSDIYRAQASLIVYLDLLGQKHHLGRHIEGTRGVSQERPS
nr:uncharacterized protein c24h6.02c [Quercus suber]